MCSDGVVRLTCGCFYGTIEEFEKTVAKTHDDNKYGREYKALIELIKVHFDLTGEKREMKKYKRLTKKIDTVVVYPYGKYEDTTAAEMTTSDIRAVMQRLAELEDKIEDGTLIELLCKVGDKVWFVYKTENDELFLDEGVVRRFSIDCCGFGVYVTYKNGQTHWHPIESIKEIVFFTKAEAEKALAEKTMEEKRSKE
jgi:hypothetical protein